MAKVVNKEEFERQKAKKHHAEMVAAIKAIKIPEPKDNSAVILKLEETISQLTDKLSTLEQPKITVQKTEINQSEVLSLLKQLIKETKALKVQEKKEEKKEEKEKKEYTFDVIRNDFGFIQSVKVKEQ